MPDAIETLLGHRSIRTFKTDPVPEADIRRAVAAGQMASTSSNVQAYCCLRVTDAAARAEIAELAGPQQKIVDCGAFFVVCGDSRRHRLIAQRHGQAYDAKLEGFLVATIDAALFAQNMCVAFEAMGYGICYIGGIRNDLPRLDRTLRLPEGVYPLFGLCVGVPDEAPLPRPRLPIDAVLFDDRYPADDEMLARVIEYDQTHRGYTQARGSAPKAWSDLMNGKYAAAQRVAVAAYYEGKGATLA